MVVNLTMSELQCRSGENTRERFPAWFEVGKSTSSLDLRARKTRIFDLDLKMWESGEGTALIWATLSLPACPYLASTFVPSLALEQPTSSGFQNIQKMLRHPVSWD